MIMDIVYFYDDVLNCVYKSMAFLMMMCGAGPSLLEANFLLIIKCVVPNTY
ncbi:hypothetical protein JYU34_004385 [Plutella xylostella]|uniref:Uncharacterized protein n=1 Tax=Plutella xylostella TaxID=51655 RepID=A0ABQ7QXU4_PLUXY|nr:hypothetical protein JYU34_004385 [Plutella xylostella]